MDIDKIIAQLRTYAPIFQNRVAGAASYSEGLETTVNMPLPAAYVYPVEDTVDDTSGMGGSLRQQIEERIAVVVQLDNSNDRRGQAAVSSVDDIKYAIFAAILNWQPDVLPRFAQGFRYAGGHLLGMDRSRLFWQYEFIVTSTITQMDGFIPPAEYLERIEIHDTVHPPLAMSIEVDNDAKALSTVSFGIHS